MLMKKTAITLTMAATLVSFSQLSYASTVCSEVATKDQAEKLMKRLFPASKIISAEPLKLSVSTSCLLEVEMLTDAGNENTKGSVYVLPDGDHFLNGPLMSKRSWVETTANPNSSTPKGSPSQNTTNPTSAMTTTMPAMAAAESPAELRKSTLRQLQDNPFIAFQFSDQPAGTANVLFDVECPFCIKQYIEMEEAAKEHDLNFNWIPVYLNEKSWAAAALLMREAKANPQKGKELMDKIMRQKITSDDLEKQYATLEESDFALAKDTNMIFADIVRQARVGTPLTFVENNDGNVKVSSGKLDLDEWPLMLSN